MRASARRALNAKNSNGKIIAKTRSFAHSPVPATTGLCWIHHRTMLDIVIIVKVACKCVSAPMVKIIRVATRQHLVCLTLETQQCAPVLPKVRLGPTTSTLLRFNLVSAI
jgi:hypothetical protein